MNHQRELKVNLRVLKYAATDLLRGSVLIVYYAGMVLFNWLRGK